MKTQYLTQNMFVAGAAASALALGCLAGTAALAHGSRHHGSHHSAKPIVLKEQGSFYAGGEIFEIPSRIATPGADPQPGDISKDHVYVQYQIPKDEKHPYPIIMVHGGGHTGKTYETTPDGREGWFTSFTRRGFASYVIDDPNRGRACCEPTELHLVRMGLLDPSQLPNMNIYTKQQAYSVFRFGPEYPVAYPGMRFPLQAIDQYAPQWVLTYRDAEENDKIKNGIIAAIDAVDGPVILMTHSQSGPRGLEAVLARADKVKAYVSIEPAGFGIPDGESAATLKDVPIFTVFGDNVELSSFATNWLDSATATAELVNAAGGNAKVLELPDVGIQGNSHMMMMDNNNEKIADIIEAWIKNNVERRRHAHHHHHRR
jgi:pimeloyl-ACP methyl ester carboxylesterase